MLDSSSSSSTPTADKRRTRIIVAFAAVYVFWGSTYLGIHYLLAGGFTPFIGSGVRMAIAGAMLWVYLRWRRKPTPTRVQLREAAIAGVFLFVGGTGLLMLAQQSLPSGLAATLLATTPFWMTGFDSLTPEGERPSAAAVCGIIVGFVGVGLLVGPRLAQGGASAGAVVTCLLSPVLWSIGGLWAKYRLRDVAPLSVTAYEILFAALFLIAVGLVRGEAQTLSPVVSGWVALGYLVVFGSLVGFSAFVYLMANVPAAQVSTYAYVNPVIAVFLGWAVAGEALSVRTLAATAVIIVGVVVVNVATSRRRALPRPASAPGGIEG